jgi:hypothetical protein
LINLITFYIFILNQILEDSMEESITPTPQTTGYGGDAIAEIRRTAAEMAGWLKFVGIVNIISGALTAISIVGIVIAWIPIWMGVLLFQAGSNAVNAQAGQRTDELVTAVKRLKTYFIINGVLIIVGVAIAILVFIFMIMGLLPFLREFNQF